MSLKKRTFQTRQVHLTGFGLLAMMNDTVSVRSSVQCGGWG
ncbi:hypothetical protein [Ammoniphilus sp. 3BR4]